MEDLGVLHQLMLATKTQKLSIYCENSPAQPASGRRFLAFRPCCSVGWLAARLAGTGFPAGQPGLTGLGPASGRASPAQPRLPSRPAGSTPASRAASSHRVLRRRLAAAAHTAEPAPIKPRASSTPNSRPPGPPPRRLLNKQINLIVQAAQPPSQPAQPAQPASGRRFLAFRPC